MKKILLASLMLIAFVGCGGDKKPSTAAQANINVQSFTAPYQKVWKVTLDTIEFDFLMGIELQDLKKGVFSTEMIRDYQPFQKRRFRLSGTLIFDAQSKSTIVKLYKHEEVLVNNDWQAIPSNSAMENQILTKVAARLKAMAPAPTPAKK